MHKQTETLTKKEQKLLIYYTKECCDYNRIALLQLPLERGLYNRLSEKINFIVNESRLRKYSPGGLALYSFKVQDGRLKLQRWC